MTEFEYLMNKVEIAKEALTGKGIAKVNGEIRVCVGTSCLECDFHCDKNNGKTCDETIKEWLGKEHIEKLLPCPFCGSENVYLYENACYVVGKRRDENAYKTGLR